jgi:uncharacterized membrane-anchored protein
MKLKLLIAVLVLQSAWILGTSIRQENLLRAGPEILLETQPVDPRDPLRGDFVLLNYQISDIPGAKFTSNLAVELPPGTTVYVAVAPTGTNGFWNVARASRERIKPATGEVMLRGKTQWSWRNNTNLVHVEYGLEKYFVAEGTGNPRGKLTVLAAVSQSGQASIKQVFIDGKPYAEVMRGQQP